MPLLFPSEGFGGMSGNAFSFFQEGFVELGLNTVSLLLTFQILIN